MRTALAVGIMVLLTAGQKVRAADEADIKPNVKALEARFKVVKQRYDSKKRQYVLTLEAETTSNNACHFAASFQDADDKEVKSVKLEFEDGGTQTIKGEKYIATVKYPTGKTMEKVSQIVIKKAD